MVFVGENGGGDGGEEGGGVGGVWCWNKNGEGGVCDGRPSAWAAALFLWLQAVNEGGDEIM